MTDQAQIDTSQDNKSLSRIQRLAWIIVLVSFAMFCSLTIAVTGSVYYFFFQSTVPMTANLQVARGTAGVVTVNEQLFPRSGPIITPLADRPTTISTDSLSQATINFSTIYNSGESAIVIGNLTLENNSSITLQNARRPRFAWSDGIYRIDLSDFSGQAELFIVNIPDRPLTFRIETQLGEAIYVFDKIGRYSLIANESIIRVTTHNGRALLIPPVYSNGRFAVDGERATLLTGTNLPTVTTAPTDLLTNGLFSFDITPNLETGSLQVPQQWGCFRDAEGAPTGEWSAGTWDGRASILLVRQNGDTTSRTGCRQWLDISVDEYSYLELQATMSLNFQSLTNCGVAGSECPMMIFIEYLDENNERRVWYQSFFSNANYDPENPAPLVCQACAQAYEHRPIAERVWYTYESGNLFSRLPEDQSPARILEVRFYASGHQYNVAVSEISLLAGSEQVTVPPDQIPIPD